MNVPFTLISEFDSLISPRSFVQVVSFQQFTSWTNKITKRNAIICDTFPVSVSVMFNHDVSEYPSRSQFSALHCTLLLKRVFLPCDVVLQRGRRCGFVFLAQSANHSLKLLD